MRWEGHVACVGGMSNEWVQNLVVQCDEGKK
jgi:hypothetical protein